MKMLQTLEDYVGGVVLFQNEPGRPSRILARRFEEGDAGDEQGDDAIGGGAAPSPEARSADSASSDKSPADSASSEPGPSKDPDPATADSQETLL
jgi:hypothetical protein